MNKVYKIILILVAIIAILYSYKTYETRKVSSSCKDCVTLGYTDEASYGCGYPPCTFTQGRIYVVFKLPISKPDAKSIIHKFGYTPRIIDSIVGGNCKVDSSEPQMSEYPCGDLNSWWLDKVLNINGPHKLEVLVPVGEEKKSIEKFMNDPSVESAYYNIQN